MSAVPPKPDIRLNLSKRSVNDPKLTSIPVERQRLTTLVYATNVIYEIVYFQYRSRLLTEDQWQVFLRAIRFTRQANTNPSFWVPGLYSDEYRRLILEIDADLEK